MTWPSSPATSVKCQKSWLAVLHSAHHTMLPGSKSELRAFQPTSKWSLIFFFFKSYRIITFWNVNILPSIPTWNGKWLSDKRCLLWPVSFSSKIRVTSLGLKTQINRNLLGLQLAGLSKPGAVPLNMVLDSLIHAISLQLGGSCLLSDYALGFASLQFWDSTVQSLNTTYISSCNEPEPASAVW